jgi:hypothetical protein
VFFTKKLKIGKSSPQNWNPVFIIKTGKNSAINFVQNDPMILKPCFLRVSEHTDSRKKKGCNWKIPALVMTIKNKNSHFSQLQHHLQQQQPF